MSLLPAFAGYGVELEYMIVDRRTLDVLPVADALLRRAAGRPVSEASRDGMAWSNELVLHLLELKNRAPVPRLAPLAQAFQDEVAQANRLLEPMGARLMPTAMHPWMDPRGETRLWPHEHAEIYRTYDRIFDCRRHGWANLQSMHLNLPFSGDGEFARLHAAVRLVLPLLPALAASSPFCEGRDTRLLDARMEAYRTHVLAVPSLIGPVIPDDAGSRSEYEARVLAPMYADIAPLDPEGVMRHEWLNARGAIARFDRSAIEIRVIDLQECPLADLAVAALAAAAVRALYDGPLADAGRCRHIDTGTLARILSACTRAADRAPIDAAAYLSVFGFPAARCTAGELWSFLAQACPVDPGFSDALQFILERGPLARRILAAAGASPTRARLRAVYAQLCDCLAQGRQFEGAAA